MRAHAFVGVTFLCVALVLVAGGCGSTPSTPASPTGTTSVAVGVSGNAPANLAPGETRQLFATATRRDGTTSDVTNLATWQSSNPAIATVSPSGVLAAAAEGSIDVFATYENVRGSLHADIKRLVCEVSVSPPAAAYGAFGGSGTVDVKVSSQSCRWTARSDSSWFPFTFDPGKAGDGSFTYALAPNSSPERRAANIIVESATGNQALHGIEEDKPISCSYVTQPAELTFSAAGGSGLFNVVATPNSCRWNAINTASSLGVFISSGFSGTGNSVVRYTVQANTRSTDTDGFIEIAGLSGQNPNGRHRVVMLKR
jgi:Bacterial Ig-like domain (group 2)